MRGQIGSSSVFVMIVLAVALLGSIGAWWATTSSEPNGSADGGSELASMRSEIAELRQEVEELRAIQSRALLEGPGPLRQLDYDASKAKGKGGSEDAQSNDMSKGEFEKAASPKGKGKGGDWAVMESLKEIEDPAQRHELAKLLLTSDEFWVRNGAIHELLKHDPAAGIEAVHEMLAAAVDEPKGGYAARGLVDALGDLEGYAVGNDLRQIYDENEIKGVDLAAARALDRRGDSSLIQREVDRYTELLQEDDPRARMRGIELLGETRSSVAVPHLLPLLDSRDVQTRIGAIQALGQAGGRNEIAVLEAMLNDPVAAVRDRAVEALASLRRRSSR